VTYSSFDPFESSHGPVGASVPLEPGADGDWFQSAGVFDERVLPAGTHLAVGPPFVWLAAAAGAGMVGGTMAALLGRVPALAVLAWAVAGPVAVALLAVFSARDARRQAAPIYTSPSWTKTAYWGVVLVVGLALLVTAWQIGQWTGRVVTQGDRACLGPVAHRRARRVVLAPGPAHRLDVSVHHRGHHLQPGAHGQRQQTLLHVPGQLGHRDRHGRRQHRRPRGRNLLQVVLAHSGPLSLGRLGDSATKDPKWKTRTDRQHRYARIHNHSDVARSAALRNPAGGSRLSEGPGPGPSLRAPLIGPPDLRVEAQVR